MERSIFRVPMLYAASVLAILIYVAAALLDGRDAMPVIFAGVAALAVVGFAALVRVSHSTP